ncbi:MAG: P1 family peptidase [Spirochaetia bacterium]|jgi:L-aminopeptidase/D-esterase-like protein|nr:P1 family peptidase [Spirochaetia bacterium]
MDSSITDIPGIKVGHAQNIDAGTGCTVILCEDGAVTGADVRGGGPGTREIAALDPVNLVSKAHAVYLGGGSAYGLDGAAGVMQYLEGKGFGFNVGIGVVPIVPGAVLFDFFVGRYDIRPDKEMGFLACQNAKDNNKDEGNIGAGTGAAVGKIKGPDYFMKGGLGTASRKVGDLIVGAIVAVNCFGDIICPFTGRIIAGTLDEEKKNLADTMSILSSPDTSKSSAFSGNTTIGCIGVNANLTKAESTKVAMMAHDGFARAINPIHTMYDGDTIFCMATGEVQADPTIIGALGAEVMAEAIVNAVKSAETAYGIPCYNDIAKKERDGDSL